jgi:hypothetical protein
MNELGYTAGITLLVNCLLVGILYRCRPSRGWLTNLCATVLPPVASFILTLALLRLNLGAFNNEKQPELGVIALIAATWVALANLAIALIVAPRLIKRFSRA